MRIQQFSDLSQNVRIPRAAFLKLVLGHMKMLSAEHFPAAKRRSELKISCT